MGAEPLTAQEAPFPAPALPGCSAQVLFSPLPPAWVPELGLCTIRYSRAPRRPLRSSRHVAVCSTRGCFFAALRGKLVTPRLLSHGSTAGGHKGQSPTPASANTKVTAGPKPGATARIVPGAYRSPRHQEPGGVFPITSERPRPAPSPPEGTGEGTAGSPQPPAGWEGTVFGATPTLSLARQCCFTGHSPHSGALGVHTVAPSSIRAWLKSPGRLLSTKALAMALREIAVRGRGPPKQRELQLLPARGGCSRAGRGHAGPLPQASQELLHPWPPPAQLPKDPALSHHAAQPQIPQGSPTRGGR